MVSTRQMATSCSGGGNGSGAGGGTNSISHTSYTEDSNSLRPSVVTRQSNAVSVVNTMPSSSSALVLASTPAAATTTTSETASSTSCARQTQAFKSYGGGSHTHSSTTGCNQQYKANINLLDLPEELLTNILSYVGYKKIAQLRVVSVEIKYFVFILGLWGMDKMLIFSLVNHQTAINK